MPFGGNCEYKDFNACVKANGSKKDPKGYCAVLMRKTEEHCANKSKSELTYINAVISKVTRLDNGQLRIAGSMSDTRPDFYRTRMSVELYKNFIRHWEELDYKVWLNVSHYLSGIVGYIERMWIDGRYFKFAGIVDNSPMGLALQERLLLEDSRSKIGFSIGFDPLDSYVDMDVYNLLVYTDGVLNHTAFTTIPANPRSRYLEVVMRARTQFDDAKELIGPTLAKWLDKQEKVKMTVRHTETTAYTEEFLDEIYAYLKSSGEVDSEDWQKAMKHARAVAGGKISKKNKEAKKEVEKQSVNEDALVISLHALMGTPIQLMDTDTLINVHDQLHEAGEKVLSKYCRCM